MAAATYEVSQAPRLTSRIKGFLGQVREILEELSRTLEAAADAAHAFSKLIWALKGAIAAVGAIFMLL